MVLYIEKKVPFRSDGHWISNYLISSEMIGSDPVFTPDFNLKVLRDRGSVAVYSTDLALFLPERI